MSAYAPSPAPFMPMISRRRGRSRSRSRSSRASARTRASSGPRMRSASLGRVTPRSASRVTPVATPSRRPRRRQRRLRKIMFGGGDYTGKFPKPRKLKKQSIKGAAAQGYSTVKDCSSTFRESQCGYIGVCPFDNDVDYNLWGALLRKYLKVYFGADVENDASVVFSWQNIGDATIGYRFGISYRNGDITTDITTGGLFTVAASTAVSFGELKDQVAAAWRTVRSTTYPTAELQDFEIYYRVVDNTGGTTYDRQENDFRNRMKVDRFKVKVYSEAILRLQNVTTGDGGGTTQDDIRNNPICGKIYHFSTPAPLLDQQEAGTYWQSISSRYRPDGSLCVPGGVIAPYIGNTANASVWPEVVKTLSCQRPVRPDYFTSCNRVTSFGLNPGEMRQLKVQFKYYGDFGTLLNNTIKTLTGDIDRQSFGTCVMMAFSKRMPTGSTSVYYSWDVHRYMSAVMKPRGVAFKPNAVVSKAAEAAFA